MLLDIIITHYKEPEELVKPLLDSLALQRNIDFKDINVIIVNDGSDLILKKSFYSKYPYNVDYYIMEHGGLSAARQYGFDKGNADYVMFCDADDVFCNSIGLWYVLVHSINERGPFDTLSTPFYEEVKCGNAMMYVMHGDVLNNEIDSTFVHGKIHRRQFIVENNIRWKKPLIYNEDSYYNTLCRKLAKEARYVSFPFYCWCWNDNSTVRSDKFYGLSKFTCLIDSNTELTKELLLRGKVEDAKDVVCNMIYSTYYELFKPFWSDTKYGIYKADIRTRFEWYIKEFYFLFDATTNEKKNAVKEICKNRTFKDTKNPDIVDFETWLGGLYDCSKT